MIRLLTSSIACLAFFSAVTQAADKDIFDYEAQKKAGDDVTKIVFIADHGTHGPRGNHEFLAASVLIARELNANYDKAYAVVHSKKHWPKDLKHADAIVVSLNHGGPAATNKAIAEAVAAGAGFAALHYGVEVNKGVQGKAYLDWMGGYFETEWSVNPHWTAEFKDFPNHPVSRGVKPFSANDEWYYHMRFRDGMKGVTPILSALPSLKTIKGEGKNTSARGGNPHVWKAVKSGEKQHVAWVYENEKKRRGFGFTGLHKHQNLANDSFRTVLLNGVAWVAKLEIPKGGVPSKKPSEADLGELIDTGRGAVKLGK